MENLKNSLQTIWEKSGFTEATTIQKQVFEPIIAGKDLVAQSPTGTGKTVAYLLPLLQNIDVQAKQVQVVILAPSQELVMQIFAEVQKWSAGMGMKSASLVGGANIKRQVEKLKGKPQLVVGTPGRILELIKMKKLKMHEVKTIVIDECDQLLVPEHMKSIETIVKSTLNERQLLLFSATKLTDKSGVEQLIDRELETIQVEKADIDSGHVQHIYLQVEERDRAKLLKKISTMQGMKALVFLRDIGNMAVLAEKLAYEQVPVAILHSDLNKLERERAITALKNGDIVLLLATDLAARGLHIDELDYVVHYDFPKTVEQYTHRSGRTGRMGNSGTVVSFVSPREEREIKKYGRELDVDVQHCKIKAGEFIPFVK